MVNMAADKIRGEIDENSGNMMALPIGEYLLQCCLDEEEELINSILNKKKSLRECLVFIINYAKTNAVKDGNMEFAGFKDEIIYAKAVEYYLRDDISEDELKDLTGSCKTAVTTPKVEVMEEKPTSESQASIFDDLVGSDSDE